MHLAAYLGVPVAAVFGSTDPVLTGPMAPPERVRILRHQVECSPCFFAGMPAGLALHEGRQRSGGSRGGPIAGGESGSCNAIQWSAQS